MTTPPYDPDETAPFGPAHHPEPGWTDRRAATGSGGRRRSDSGESSAASPSSYSPGRRRAATTSRSSRYADDSRYSPYSYDSTRSVGGYANGGYTEGGRPRRREPASEDDEWYAGRRSARSSTPGRRATRGPGGSGSGGPGDGNRRPPRKGGKPPEGRGRRILRRVLLGTLLAFVISLVGAVSAFAIGYAMIDKPNPNQEFQSDTTILYYSDGKTELGRLSGGQKRISVDLDQVPKDVQNVIVAAENRTFWTDSGIDPMGLIRGLWNTVSTGSKQGGSTITQQYVKNFYLEQDQTIERKVKELFITLKVNQELSKEQILQNYLNTSYYGRGAYGIQMAAQAYFGKDVQELNVREGAVIAALLRAPSIYDPYANEGNDKRLEARFRYALRSMEEVGQLEPGFSKKAKLPKVLPPNNDQTFAGPEGFLLTLAKRELMEKNFTEKRIETEGLRITTTFDRKAQRALERAVKRESPKKDAKGVRIGAASVRPVTGEVVALYGGPDYLERQWNDATQSKLQPGSTFKAFALAAALEQGISLESRFAGNSPYKLPGDQVANEFDEDYGEYVDLLEATEKSINTAFVDLTVTALGNEQKSGEEMVKDAAIRAGVPADSPGLTSIPKISLGQASVAPIDMANAYATFAAGGQRAEWHVVDKVTTKDGKILYQAEPNLTQAFDLDVVKDVNYALRQVVENGTGDEAKKLGRPAAGKTGTHEDQTAWFVGYTPQLSTAVAFYKDANGDGILESLDWVGGMETFFGGGYPARVWTAYMKEALKGLPKETFGPPAKIGEVVNPEPEEPVYTPPVDEQEEETSEEESEEPTVPDPGETEEPTDPTTEPSPPTDPEVPADPTTEPTDPPEDDDDDWPWPWDPPGKEGAE